MTLNQAVAYYEKAIAADPSYAEAYVGLADTLWIRVQVGEVHPLDPSWERACDLLLKALELDPGWPTLMRCLEPCFGGDTIGRARTRNQACGAT